MQNLKSNKIAQIFLTAAVLSAIIAIGLGVLHSQFSDPESSTPAPYIGLLAFILGVISFVLSRHAKQQNMHISPIKQNYKIHKLGWWLRFFGFIGIIIAFAYNASTAFTSLIYMSPQYVLPLLATLLLFVVGHYLAKNY